jgi:hypothetical protein
MQHQNVRKGNKATYWTIMRPPRARSPVPDMVHINDTKEKREKEINTSKKTITMRMKR